MMNDARIGFRLVEALATLIVERRETRTDRSVEHQSTSEILSKLRKVYEASRFYRRADYRSAEGARGRGQDGRSGAKARDLGGDILQVEGQLWWHGRLRGQRLNALEEENAKLKKLLAEQMLDAAVLRELLSKNGRPAAKPPRWRI